MILDGKYIIVDKYNIDIIFDFLKNKGYFNTNNIKSDIKININEGQQFISFFIYEISNNRLSFGVYSGGLIPGDVFMKNHYKNLEKLNINSLLREVKLKRILK